MMTLDLVQSTLKNPTALNGAEEKNTPEHFDKIVTYIEQEKINEAVRLIEKSFVKGIPDIRLIVYYYYAHFFTHGIKSFLIIFPSLISTINEHWDILRPLNSKEKQVQSSLNWFFSQIINKLKYCEKLFKTGKMHPVWEKSINEISREELQNLRSLSIEVKNFFMEKWPTAPVKERVMHLLKKIEEISILALNEGNKLNQEEEEIFIQSAQEDVAEQEKTESLSVDFAPPSPETANELLVDEQLSIVQDGEKIKDNNVEPIEEAVANHDSTKNFQPENPCPPLQDTLNGEAFKPIEEVANASFQENSTPLPSPVSAPQQVLSDYVLGSFSIEKMEIFFNKLKMFESLINKNDYVKAALVARDIDQMIENFDPLAYFPKLFSTYFSLLAKHVAALSQQWDNKESLQLKFLEKLYQTDIEKFLNW